MRHGKGKWVLKDGTVIFGDFRNDKCEGLASYKPPDASDPEIVIFKDGIKIDLDGNYPNAGAWVLLIFQLCLIVVTLGSIPLRSS